jgi:hypothetical protein
LQRWFRQAGLAPAPRGRRPHSGSGRARQPHEVWQVDATEHVRLANGQQVSWLRIVDEHTAAVLDTTVFPHGVWAAVGAAAVQGVLRRAFGRWGRPRRLRLDNGVPWGSSGDLPTDLALWLMGLAIDLVWNPPRRPQESGTVEGSQRTGKRWAEPHTCSGPDELQRRLDRLDRLQREEYPSVGGHSRREAFPQLAHSGRRYRRAWERRHWSLKRVLHGLAGYAVPRQVDHQGRVSLYGRNLRVGAHYRDREVYARLDPEAKEWVFADRDGRELARRPARELTRERIVGLSLAGRRRQK